MRWKLNIPKYPLKPHDDTFYSYSYNKYTPMETVTIIREYFNFEWNSSGLSQSHLKKFSVCIIKEV